jgi:hypothetical protein
VLHAVGLLKATTLEAQAGEAQRILNEDYGPLEELQPPCRRPSERFIPLHFYLLRALDLMYEHLGGGRPLPPSQVVHTTPRGRTPGVEAPPIEIGTHLPPIGRGAAGRNAH